MEDNSKHTNGIGHNSKLNDVAYYGQPPITKAVLELVRDAKESTAKALKLCSKIQEKYAAAFKGEEPLTDDQQDINYQAENHNTQVQRNEAKFRGKYKLRKIIKPRKLNVNQKHEQFHGAEKIYQDCWMEIHCAESGLRQLLDHESILAMLDESELQNVKRDKVTSNDN